MKISGLINDSVVDGPGWRMTIFTQGCPHHCHNCHNPETWDYNGGYEISVDELVNKYKNNPLLDGITLSGGEPFIKERKEELIDLVESIKSIGGSVWAYSGYLIEELEREYSEVIKNIDYIVDGVFIEEKKSLGILFRGSTNQRIMKNVNGIWIDVSAEFDNRDKA